MIVPAPPEKTIVLDRQANSTFYVGLADIVTEMRQFSDKNAELSTHAKNLNQNSFLFLHKLKQGESSADHAQTLLDASTELIEKVKDDERARNFNGIAKSLNKVVSFHCFTHFLATGKLLPRSDASMERFSDTEYLLGVIDFCRELEQYGIRRATRGDVQSVQCAKGIIEEINHELLQFDFRNGTLRKNYDGMKYFLRQQEDLLYDLSIVKSIKGETPVPDVGASAETRVCASSFEKLKASMHAYDQERENVIVKCRSIQKLGKNSIYSCHRGNLQVAEKQLKESAEMSVELTKHINANASLGSLLVQGSFPQALEEFGEGALFLAWLQSDNQVVYNRQQIADQYGVALSASVYVNALVDFTGEVGRWAVAQATKRHVDKVELAYAPMMMIQDFLLQLSCELDLKTNNVSKSMDTVERNCKKVQRVLYDLSKGDVKTLAARDDLEDGAPHKKRKTDETD